METSRDLIRIKDSTQAELYIGDWGYLGVQLVILSPDHRWAKTLIAPSDLSPLIDTLTRLRDRNIRELK